MLLGIVILNYNTWKETYTCVNSIEKFYKESSYKIYIVDNCSSEKISDEMKAELLSYGNIEIIYNKENRGFAAGNNVGLKKAMEDKCTHFLICNSDIIIVDQSISHMCSYINENLKVGIVGPQIYDINNRFQPFYMLCELDGMGKLKNMMLKTPFKIFLKRFEHNFIRKEEISEPLDVFGVSGCCFMVSERCIKEVYPLDEHTFLYEEEYILGYKMKKSNYKIRIIPKTHIVHVHGVSTGRISAFSYQCMIDSEQYYLKEYLHTNIFLRKLIWVIRMILKKYERVSI